MNGSKKDGTYGCLMIFIGIFIIATVIFFVCRSLYNTYSDSDYTLPSSIDPSKYTKQTSTYTKETSAGSKSDTSGDENAATRRHGSSSSDDPYDIDEYSDAEEFYYFHVDDFYDFEDAENYYNEHVK